ncbi:glycoside hydrolase [Acidobacteria bacterium AH-259-L09]|nr:glycoside hydrolase [Acidobacteria bacterium AH-259-L09]
MKKPGELGSGVNMRNVGRKVRTPFGMVAFSLTAVLLLQAAGGGELPNPALSPNVLEIKSPAGPGSGEANISTAPDGRVFLSWLEPSGDRYAFRFSVRQGRGWSAPLTISSGQDWFVNWADFPSLIALADGSLAAHWLVKSSGGTYSYDVYIARSSDGGQTWGKPMIPHRDGTPTEHGFVSLLPWGKSQLAAVWLDGREMAAGKGAREGHGGMNLRHIVIGADGLMGQEILLDGRVCECCQTSAAMTPQGAIVAYRDRSELETRDISVVRFVGGRWSEPQTLHGDGWEIPGCPVNGPAVSAEGQQVAIAWFTAAKAVPRVYIVFSTDGGQSFGKPVRIDEGHPLGRVDTVLLPHGGALVSWLKATGDRAELRVRRVLSDGSFQPSWLIAGSSAARASGFPRMERSGDEIVFAWTDVGGHVKRVRTAVARLKASD